MADIFNSGIVGYPKKVTGLYKGYIMPAVDFIRTPSVSLNFPSNLFPWIIGGIYPAYVFRYS
jgi:hypothetical protein